MSEFIRLVEEIRRCDQCGDHLPLGPRPVFQADPRARILVVGQAPGTAVHATGIPFNDPSGDRLRAWMGIGKETFYDPAIVALVPMGFCYPGRGKGGDLPPRPECAATWRGPLLAHLTQIQLTIMVGRYAIDWHLPDQRGKPLTEVCRNWRNRAPALFALPHPSPRNTLWLRRNPWLESEVVPGLRKAAGIVLTATP